MKKKLLFLFLVFSLVHVSAVTLFAQRWADAMFKERRHNFGTIALGVETVYRFKFKNPYQEDVHIADVTSSCHCTDVSPSQKYLKLGETGEIIAKLNTGGAFTGSRQATLTVFIDRPSPAEVQLQVTAYIRPDVVVTPGVANFGSVAEGKTAVKKLKMEYAGHNDWGITAIERTNRGIHVAVDLVERGNGRVIYDITVTLKNNLPSGYIHDMVRFITNDPHPEVSSVMLPVQGYITAPLVAKPSPFMVGVLTPGKTITKNIVLRSETPFKIVNVISDDKRFHFALTDVERSIHVVPVTFKANSISGNIIEPIIFQTTLDNQRKIYVSTQGRVIPEILPDYSRTLLADRSLKDTKTHENIADNAIANPNNAPLTPLTDATTLRLVQKNADDVPSLPSPPQFVAKSLDTPLVSTTKQPTPNQQPHPQLQPPVKIATEQAASIPHIAQEPFFEPMISAVPKTSVQVTENRPSARLNVSHDNTAKQTPPLNNIFEIVPETPQQSQTFPSTIPATNSTITAPIISAQEQVAPPVLQKNSTNKISEDSSAVAQKSNGLVFAEPSVQENLALMSQPKQKVVNMTDVFTLENGIQTKNQVSRDSGNAFENVSPTRSPQLVTQLEVPPRASENVANHALKTPDLPRLSTQANAPIQITTSRNTAPILESAPIASSIPENPSVASEDADALIASLMGKSNNLSATVAPQKITPQSIPNHSFAAELKPLVETNLTNISESPSVTPQLTPLISPTLPMQQKNGATLSAIAVGEMPENELLIRRLPDRQTFEREAMQQPELQSLPQNEPPERIALAPQARTTQNLSVAPNNAELVPLRPAQSQGQSLSPPNNVTNKIPNTQPRPNVRNGVDNSQNTEQTKITKTVTNQPVTPQPPLQNNTSPNNKRPTTPPPPPRPTIAPAPVFR
ncbi:MAG: DUF1573 domain-containing protein [Planctomycetaceae bacterium]|jgi:hypothetical protein|nr:DUF1573 domain-containing protein [Planctomycetaceae bacterium]